EIKNNLYDMIKRLKAHAVQGSFTHSENLHLTLVFLGEVESDKVGRIKQTMDKVTAEPFILTMGGLGRFQRGGGDIYWLGIERSETLLSIHNQLRKELVREGFAIEKQEYKPHLTLGREIILNQQFNQAEFCQSILAMKAEIGKISLMKSERIKGKLIYTEIYGKKLGV
ncbi:MAG: RNA 2',3'-cyclic phosphodiesterase, partial [Clostridia bacterium]|nr:RNA 2',3'-cyclic phosphodiesterase [Clostridia bacterium]